MAASNDGEEAMAAKKMIKVRNRTSARVVLTMKDGGHKVVGCREDEHLAKKLKDRNVLCADPMVEFDLAALDEGSAKMVKRYLDDGRFQKAA